jgi:hypothetical protein
MNEFESTSLNVNLEGAETPCDTLTNYLDTSPYPGLHKNPKETETANLQDIYLVDGPIRLCCRDLDYYVQVGSNEIWMRLPNERWGMRAWVLLGLRCGSHQLPSLSSRIVVVLRPVVSSEVAAKIKFPVLEP